MNDIIRKSRFFYLLNVLIFFTAELHPNQEELARVENNFLSQNPKPTNEKSQSPNEKKLTLVEENFLARNQTSTDEKLLSGD